MALADRWCLVTGGNKGIGRSIALKLAKEKANLILTARDVTALEQTAKDCGTGGAGAVETLAVDATDPKAVDALATDIISRHGGVHMLVNNAGRVAPGTLDGDPDDWDAMYRLNVSAPMRLTRRFTPGMIERKEGVIVNIGSVYGVLPSTAIGAYASTKWAMRGWSSSIAEALRPHNIKVTNVQPGFVGTEMAVGVSQESPDKMIHPDDVAEAVMLVVRTSAKCTPEEITLKEVPPLREHYP